MGIDFTKLSEPFAADDVEWRVQSCGKKDGAGVWAIVIPYIQNRAIMDRLDSVCGPENWKNEYQRGPDGGILCAISIRCREEWVTKWDGAANTEVKEGGKLDEDTNIKGGLSASMKRAGVQWGIGRYLYNLEASFAIIDNQNGKYRGKTKDDTVFRWNPPDLPAWALPDTPGKKLKEIMESTRAGDPWFTEAEKEAYRAKVKAIGLTETLKQAEIALEEKQAAES